jgi:hypothetical protein
VIDAVLGFKIVGIGRGPMLIQRRTDLLISHSRILLVLLWIVLLWIVHLEPSIGTSIVCAWLGRRRYCRGDKSSETEEKRASHVEPLSEVAEHYMPMGNAALLRQKWRTHSYF